MQIWPAIDLRGGNCVRLLQGDYNQETVFGTDPPAMAQRWVAEGARFLHLVDLDGARDGLSVNRDAVKAIVEAVDIPCELGGGIRDEQTITDLLAIGLSRLVVGTRALTDPQWFREMSRKYPHKLVAGIDARNGQVATEGWLQTSDVAATDLARSLADEPIAAVIYTDIAKDGMMAGPNLAAMAEMAQAVHVPVIASGGVCTPDDVRSLAEAGLAGCIIGRTLYEGKMTLAEAATAAEAGSKNLKQN